MGELMDFLVWLQRKHTSDVLSVPVQLMQLIGVYAVEFLEEQEEGEG